MPEEEQIDESIEKSDKQIKYGICNRRTKFDKNAKLFPNGKPNYKDVKQGYTDLDCFFLNVVAGMARSKPGKLLKCFPEYDGLEENEINEKFSEAEKVKILFYKTKSIRGGYARNGKVEISVDKTALRDKGVPWVRLLEKAYAVYRANGYDAACSVEGNSKRVKSRIIDGINGGDSASVIVTLTGNSSRSVCLGNDEERSKVKKFNSTRNAEGKEVASYGKKVLEIFEDIQENLKKGNIVTAYADRGSSIYSKGLFLNHCYTVIDAYEKGCFKYVVVRNPYANRSRVYEKDSKGAMHSKVTVHEEEDKKGVSELELNDFFKYFKYVETEDAVPENPSSESSLSKD